MIQSLIIKLFNYLPKKTVIVVLAIYAGIWLYFDLIEQDRLSYTELLGLLVFSAVIVVISKILYLISKKLVQKIKYQKPNNDE